MISLLLDDFTKVLFYVESSSHPFKWSMESLIKLNYRDLFDIGDQI